MTCYAPSTMTAFRNLADHDERPREDHFVHLREATWDDYQRVLRMRGDRSAPRISYLEGVIEIMSPSRHHEAIKSVLGRLVEVWCLEHEIPFSTYGSWTLENKKAKRGAEPDECYVFGEVENPERPELAIEVIWTSGGVNKLEVYRGLGVGEVWIWRKGKLHPYVLRDGAYEPAPRSLVLPEVDLDLLASFVDRKTTSESIQGYRKAIKTVSDDA